MPRTKERSFGQVLRDRRRQLDLTQEEVARRIKTSTPYIGHLESAKRHPSDKIVTRLAEVLGLDRRELFFLANPRAIAAFGRECTRRGVPPPTVTLFGNPFLTWRGIPLIPTDKIRVAGKTPKTKILLVRVGERKQGVIGLFQPGLTGEQSPGLSVRFKGISDRGLSSYLISLYCSASVLADDAIAALDDVEVGQYHEYK